MLPLAYTPPICYIAPKHRVVEGCSYGRSETSMKLRTLQGILLGVYTFAYAKGWSYLTDDPAACANCHVMREQFDGWLKSSHRAVATCNHCHTPANFIGKYATKASNGFWHSFFFTTGGYEDTIQIKPHSRE